jgi:general stress protein YciG
MSSSGGSAPGEFAHGKAEAHEAGKKGGQATGANDSGSAAETDGQNNRGSNQGGFAHGKVDPHEAGKKGT